jgi:cytochrome c peroxidase
MKTSSLLVVCGLVLGSMSMLTAADTALRLVPPEVADAEGTDRLGLDCGAEPCRSARRGRKAFFDRRLRGLEANGRSCNDCHMATDHFQLSPASVEARFQELTAPGRGGKENDDPLFRPIDADDFRSRGENAADYSNLRQHALIRIEMPLPPTIRLIDPETDLPSAETFVDVWRMVPTVNDVALTGPDGVNPWPRGPNHFGGYQLDGRLATLQEQALGALSTHAQGQHAPTQRMLDDLASFQRLQFTNDRVRALAEAVAAGETPLPDPDPRLSALEERGKAVFVRACGHCHGGPGLSTPQAPLARFHDIATQCPRPVDTATPARYAFEPCASGLARNVRTYSITLINGTVARRTSSDPGRALLSGFVGGAAPTDDWNKFDIPGLRGISKTAPYFHNNSAATLEAMVDHYVEFFKRVKANAAPGVVPLVATTDGVNFDRQPTPEERAPLLAYLRKL